ncbi:MAG: hypothetical protein K6G03_10220, partial [Lachnospiraceae bacterium]|nr:hypothetical protein [Lachnospiraceae bacterium]
MKKRTIVLSILLAMTISMIACGSHGNKAEATATTAAVEKATETGEETTVSSEASEAEATAETATEAASAEATASVTDTESPDYVIELDPQYTVPTEELLKKFPIEYQTPAETELSKKIQNRMLNGFNRWNMGYDAWEHWG